MTFRFANVEGRSALVDDDGITYLSSILTLTPGDLIFTGTPEGSAPRACDSSSTGT